MIWWGQHSWAEGLTSWVIFIPVDCNIITAYILCQRVAPDLIDKKNDLKGKLWSQR
jgi:hypothetical protein